MSETLRNSLGLVAAFLIAALWYLDSERGIDLDEASDQMPAISRQAISAVAEAQGDPAKLEFAERLTQTALRIDSRDPVALFTSGWIHHLRGDSDQAYSQYKSALNELEDLAKATRYNLALIYRDRGEMALALREVQIILSTDSSHRNANLLKVEIEKSLKR